MFLHSRDSLLRWPESLSRPFDSGPPAPRRPYFRLWGRLSDRRHRPTRTSSPLEDVVLAKPCILAPSPASSAQSTPATGARVRLKAPARHRENRRWRGRANTTAATPQRLHRCGVDSVLQSGSQRARVSAGVETKNFHTHTPKTAACDGRCDTACWLWAHDVHSAGAGATRLFRVRPTLEATYSNVPKSTHSTFAPPSHRLLLLVALFFCILPLAYPPWVNAFGKHTPLRYGCAALFSTKIYTTL